MEAQMHPALQPEPGLAGTTQPSNQQSSGTTQHIAVLALQLPKAEQAGCSASWEARLLLPTCYTYVCVYLHTPSCICRYFHITVVRSAGQWARGRAALSLLSCFCLYSNCCWGYAFNKHTLIHCGTYGTCFTKAKGSGHKGDSKTDKRIYIFFKAHSSTIITQFLIYSKKILY